MTRRQYRFAASRAAVNAVPKPAVDLSSMVDIGFLLLIIFWVTSTLDPREADLGFRLLPESGIDSVRLEGFAGK